MSDKPVLVINSGSSSLKFAVILTGQQEVLAAGIAERLGTAEARLVLQVPQKTTKELPRGDHQAAIEALFAYLERTGIQPDRLLGVGHRVVHGGESFHASTLIDSQVLEQIATCSRLAPLHNPANLQGIEATRRLFPNLPQVAVFDTAFHQSLPPQAYLYALPYELYQDQGVRRYGFHGTSHRFVAGQAAERLGKPLAECQMISVHLGNGCSATAIKNGQSLDTTMGLTPLEGLVMGTRSGDLDPGILFHLADHAGYTLDQLNRLLNRESGLLGLSGLSNDMRSLQQAAEQGHARAQLAIDIFCYRLAKAIGALAMTLKRIDALVFTGGIGENSALVRAQVIGQLGLLGFELDPDANVNAGRQTGGRVTTNTSTPALVVATNEELMIAQDTAHLILEQRGTHRG